MTHQLTAALRAGLTPGSHIRPKEINIQNKREFIWDIFFGIFGSESFLVVYVCVYVWFNI